MRRSQAVHETSVGLFAFLDVLMSTMGSLILVLMIVSPKIRQEKIAKAATEVARDVVKIETKPVPTPAPAVVPKRETIDLNAKFATHVAELTSQADDKRRTATDAQHELATAHDRSQKVHETREQLEHELADLRAAKTRLVASVEDLSAEGVKVETELARRGSRLRKIRDHIAHESTEYAFVAYDGVSGTTRRPILVECADDRIKFVQENITLTSADITGFTSVANPLLSGAEALLDYWSTHASASEPKPYVLMVVRPSGTLSYYRARNLLERMKAPFGYELLPEDQKLAPPAADPQATLACREAIDRAIAKRDAVFNQVFATTGGSKRDPLRRGPGGAGGDVPGLNGNGTPGGAKDGSGVGPSGTGGGAGGNRAGSTWTFADPFDLTSGGVRAAGKAAASASSDALVASGNTTQRAPGGNGPGSKGADGNAAGPGGAANGGLDGSGSSTSGSGSDAAAGAGPSGAGTGAAGATGLGGAQANGGPANGNGGNGPGGLGSGLPGSLVGGGATGGTGPGGGTGAGAPGGLPAGGGTGPGGLGSGGVGLNGQGGGGAGGNLVAGGPGGTGGGATPGGAGGMVAGGLGPNGTAGMSGGSPTPGAPDGLLTAGALSGTNNLPNGPNGSDPNASGKPPGAPGGSGLSPSGDLVAASPNQSGANGNGPNGGTGTDGQPGGARSDEPFELLPTLGAGKGPGMDGGVPGELGNSSSGGDLALSGAGGSQQLGPAPAGSSSAEFGSGPTTPILQAGTGGSPLSSPSGGLSSASGMSGGSGGGTGQPDSLGTGSGEPASAATGSGQPGTPQMASDPGTTSPQGDLAFSPGPSAGSPSGGAPGGGSPGGGSMGSDGGNAGQSASGSVDASAGAGGMPSLGHAGDDTPDNSFATRHWGYSTPQAHVGFNHDVSVWIGAHSIVVGSQPPIPISRAESAPRLAAIVVPALDREARTWGRPPDHLYWVPNVKFVVSPGGNLTYERLRPVMQRHGMISSVEYRLELESPRQTFHSWVQ
jgi:hypothetical protein